jgi:hypothetical protein
MARTKMTQNSNMDINDLQNQVNMLNNQATMNAPVPENFNGNFTDIRPDIAMCNPSQTGYLPLIPMFESAVRKIKEQFNLTTDINDIWLHINRKMFSDVPQNELHMISQYNVMEHLYTCIDNNLNPLKSEVGSYYDKNAKAIKTQILLEGYNKIYSTHVQSNGLEYRFGEDVKKNFIETVWEYNPQTHRKEPKKIEVTKTIPRFVECRIFRKDMMHPTIGYAFPDDISNTGAWQGHPSQMMCNRAFTRAVRMAYNLEGTSSEDVSEIKYQHNQEMQNANVEQELKYQKAVNLMLANLGECTNLQDFTQLVNKFKPTIENLPADYRKQYLGKMNEINTFLRQQAAQMEQGNPNQEDNSQTAQGQMQSQGIPPQQNTAVNEDNLDTFDFEQQQMIS